MTWATEERVAAATVDIQELREAWSDGGALMGYFCRGHIDPVAFADAANHYSGAMIGYDTRYVDVSAVEYHWWRTVPIAGDDGCTRFVSAEPHGRGAYSVTVCESVENNDRKEAEAHIASTDRGVRSGFAQGVNWAARQLEAMAFPTSAERLLQAYRDKPAAEKGDGK